MMLAKRCRYGVGARILGNVRNLRACPTRAPGGKRGHPPTSARNGRQGNPQGSDKYELELSEFTPQDVFDGESQGFPKGKTPGEADMGSVIRTN